MEYDAAGALLRVADVERAAAEIVAEAPPLLRRIRDDLRQHQLEDAARRLLRDPPRFTRLDDELVRLELIGLAKRSGEHWAPRNPLLAAVFHERLEVEGPSGSQRTLADPAAVQLLREALDAPVQAPELAPMQTVPVRPPLKAEAEATTAADRAAPAARPPALAKKPSPPETAAHDEWAQRDPVNPNWRAERLSRSKQRSGANIPQGVLVGAVATLLALVAYAAWTGLSGAFSQQEVPTSQAATSSAPAAMPLPAWVPTLVEVPAGPFLMGSDDSDTLADDDEKPQHTLELSTY